MSVGMYALGVFGLLLSVFYTLWPLLILLPLPGASNSGARRMLRIWMVLALLRILLFWKPFSYASFMPEPLYTLLFILAGAQLIGLGLVRRIRFQRAQARAERDQSGPLGQSI